MQVYRAVPERPLGEGRSIQPAAGQMMKVDPLEFDGVNDSVFQEFTEDGHARMEHQRPRSVRRRPFDFILAGCRRPTATCSPRRAVAW